MEWVVDRWRHWEEFYQSCLDKADKRVEAWFLMESFTPTLVLTLVYLIIVKLGMEYMKNREPLKFKYTLFLYNMGLVGLNFHICYELITATTRKNYSYSCQPVDYSDDPDEMRIAKALWWYYFSKFIEFMDTIFFVMRKKNSQVSFLHVYHHATMFPIWWIGIKWVPGGQSFFGAMINSFIHVIMYSYYGISALGPEYQRFLWWKRYLTKLQLLQFLIGMVYAAQSLYYECEYPRWMQYAALVYGVTIIALFLNFYIRAYVVKPGKIQFLAGMYHAAQSLYVRCEFPEWMQWALMVYGLSILSLFLNFYFHAYINVKKSKKEAVQNGNNGMTKNGHIQNGYVEKKMN